MTKKLKAVVDGDEVQFKIAEVSPCLRDVAPILHTSFYVIESVECEGALIAFIPHIAPWSKPIMDMLEKSE